MQSVVSAWWKPVNRKECVGTQRNVVDSGMKSLVDRKFWHEETVLDREECYHWQCCDVVMQCNSAMLCGRNCLKHLHCLLYCRVMYSEILKHSRFHVQNLQLMASIV